MTAYIRKLHLLSFLFIITLFSSCGEVKNDGITYFGGEIINPNSKFVYLCKNNLIIDSIKLDAKNRFLKKYDTLTPGMYTFKHDPEYQYIYFDKNDSLMIRLNTNEFDNSLTFCGRGDEKNNFLMDLFLKNEEDKNNSFGTFDANFKTFSSTIDQEYNSRKSYYARRKIDINWNEDFDLYAKTMLDMHYLAKKEMYPFAHERRTNENVFKNLPKNYYDYRKDIDFNNEKLTNFSPFVRYLTAMMNNISWKDNKEKSLDNNIKKLHLTDSIFTNVKIKNAILNNIAFAYLLEDQNMVNNKNFLDQYAKLSTDSENQKEIKQIGAATQLLLSGKKLPSVALINNQNAPININDLITSQTIIFFWTSEAKSHMNAAHIKALELQKEHPNLTIIAINIDKNITKWKEILSKSDFKNIVELHATNFEDLRAKWVITKIHRAMILNKSGTIDNAFVSLFDAKFAESL